MDPYTRPSQHSHSSLPASLPTLPPLPREFGRVFSWKLGPERMVAVMDYDTIKSLLQHGDSKVRRNQ